MHVGPFYANAINRESEAHWRLLLIFANRATADEWWREVSKDPTLSNIQRFTPQIYTYDNSKAHLIEFFTYGYYKSVSNKFIGRMLIQLENDRGGRGRSTAPPAHITDHLSGNCYFICSTADPNLYWCFETPSGRITLTNDEAKRSAFRVKATEESDGTVMIGEDNIIISPAPDVHIGVGTKGELIPSRSSRIFKFKDFAQGKFLFDQSGQLVYSPDNCSHHDVWELV